jgi:methionyl-tRNA synthetase
MSKIKIVDVGIEAEEDEGNTEQITEQSYNEILPIEDEATIPEVIPEPEPETKTKQRIQQLEECQNCGKMLTPKSLKYNHKLYCGVSNENKPKSRVKKPEPKQTIPEVVEAIIPPPTVHQSFEDMRRERVQQRMNDKRESAKQLFLQAV